MTRAVRDRAQKGNSRAAVIGRAREPIVVGIGASAGGLESISALLRVLPSDTGNAYVVVQHFGSRHKSMLGSIISRTTQMPVTEIARSLPIEPNHVYVGLPGHDVFVQNGALGPCIRERRAAIDGQVDTFLKSLAASCGPRAVAVILSGTGSDGTVGAREIKRNGGITFAEAASSAQYRDMPMNAVNAGVIDHVQSAAEIGNALSRLALAPEMARPKPDGIEAGRDIPATALQKIFRVLRASENVDFSDYKPTTIKRRILRRMALRRIRGIDQYGLLVQRDPREAASLFQDLLINVTGFFRDTKAFHALEKMVLPRLIAEKGGEGELRIWVPGCATGQEVYSIAICVLDSLARSKATMGVQLFGTDLSEKAIAYARAGVYPAASMRDVSAAHRRRYFTRKNGSFVVSRTIRDLCTFARQNLVSDPPFSRLDLISCRNLLIYFGPNLQGQCLPLFYYALNANGFLFLGGSETIGKFADLFSLMDKKNKIYRKKVTARARDSFLKKSRLAQQQPGRLSAGGSPAEPARAQSPAGSVEIQSVADQLILTHFAPCGVVIDGSLQVWHFRGDTSPFLKQSPGAATLNLLKLVCRGLTADLSAAIQLAIKSGEPARKDALMVATNAGMQNVHIEVVPFTVASGTSKWFLVIFEAHWQVEASASKRNGRTRQGSHFREIARLREELRTTRESLQLIIESQDAASETIKSANEEIESSNEELQSTNEELETAKEELQSTNEELSTVNDELNNRNLEINDINNDLNDLLSSINIAVVLVDNALTIRRSTPLAEKLFNIIPSDTGRKLSDINPNFDLPTLPLLIRAVIDDLIPCLRDVQDKEGSWYSLRIRPYRTRKNIIDGVVITLVDINPRSEVPVAHLPPGKAPN
jgi:two-component system, chemotaxis family, CheB/CheR fusion protein